MQKNLYTYLLATACLFFTNTNLWAQRHYLQLVKEIDAPDVNTVIQQTDFIAVDGETYFLHTKTHTSGAVLQTIYKTNGTASSTISRVQILLSPSNAVNKIQGLVSLNNRILYLKNNGLVSFNPQNNDVIDITNTLNIVCSVVHNGYFYFVSSVPNSTELGLYSTDGTVAAIAPLAVLSGTNTSSKAQISILNQQITLSYTDANSVHFGVLPQGSSTFQHLQQHTTDVTNNFTVAPIVYNNTMYWTYNDTIFKSDGTPQGSVITSLPSVASVRAWTSFGNRILVMTKDTCTTIRGVYPYYNTNCPIYLVSTDGNSAWQHSRFGGDYESGAGHGTSYQRASYRFFENNQKLYIHTVGHDFNSIAANEDYLNQIYEFSNLDTLPVSILPNTRGLFSQNMLIKDDFLFLNSSKFTYSGFDAVYKGLFRFNLETHTFVAIDERQCQPLTLANNIIYTSTLHSNGASQPFKIETCAAGIFTPSITNIRYDTTGADIKLYWTAPLNSTLITDFGITKDSLVFGSSGQTELQHLVATIPYNPAQSDYYYAFPKPTNIGITAILFNLKTNTTTPACTDTLRKTSFGYCNSQQPSINITATYDSLSAKSYIDWGLVSSANLINMVELYKNNVRIYVFQGLSVHSFLDTLAHANDVYHVKVISNNNCNGSWQKTAITQSINCNALKPTLGLLSSDTIFDASQQQYRARLVWSVQGGGFPLDSFKVYQNEQYLASIASSSGINGIYTYTIPLTYAPSTFFLFKIKTTMPHPLCAYQSDLITDTLRIICPLQVRIENFVADTLVGSNAVKLTWKAYNISNINHFQIQDNTGRLLATIQANNGIQGNYTYNLNFEHAVTNETYTLSAVSKNSCNTPQLLSNPVSTICRSSEKMSFSNLTQNKKETKVILNFQIEKKSYTRNVSVVENGVSTSLVASQQNNNTLQYQYEYICQDFLVHNLELKYSEIDANNCRNNTKIIIINCDVKDYEMPFLLPNPATTQFTIALPNKKMNAKIRILSSNGSFIEQFEQYYNTLSVDCSTYISGVYIVEVNDGTNITALKLVKL
jgi:Secretion system C-terminal sorting domain